MPLFPTYKASCPENSPIEHSSRESLSHQFNFPQEYLNQSWLKTMVVDHDKPAKYTYPIQATKPYDRDMWTVSSDHCYSRPWAWQPESGFLKPTKALFSPRNINVKPLFSAGSFSSLEDEHLDVENDAETLTPVYDFDKAKVLMEECEKHVLGSFRSGNDDGDWEERIIKSNWSSTQHRLFNGFVNILNSFYLGKLTYMGQQNEPVLRRSIIDKAVHRVRRLFNTVSYDIKLLQWLHQLLLDNLDQHNLPLYLDTLQTLRSKIPKIVDRILNNGGATVQKGPLTNENLLPLLKKPWDPMEEALQQDKPKKLPSNPIIVLMPCSPGASKRNNKWMELLSSLAQVVTVPTNFGTASTRMTMTNCIDQMFSVTRGRIQEVRENNPGRNIILAGVGAGATLALQVAQVENVFCIVSLGFSMLTAEGRRGEPDDNLLELQSPVLFVIGQCSSTAFQEDMEDLRGRMRIETGLIVVGSADNNLIVSKKKKREEGITQKIVDKSIIDEVGEFLSNLLLSPYPPQIRQSPATVPPDHPPLKKTKLERKRYNSNTSSIDSEPPSPTPTPRLPRPGIHRKLGRPAGKSTKCKLEAKWAAQVAQGTSSSNSNTAPFPSRSAASTPPPSLDQSNNYTPSSSETASATGSPIASPTDMMATHTASPSSKGGGGGSNMPPSSKSRDQGRNVMPGGQLSTLLQGGIKTIPPVHNSKTSSPQIKVLENVTLTSQATAKLITTTPAGRSIDFSKLNLGQTTTTSTGGSNVVLQLPEGKLKSLTPSRSITMKTSAGTPIVLSLPGKVNPAKSKFISTPHPGTPFGKFLTTRRLPARSTPIKRQNFISFPKPIGATAPPLPPPTNLTTQDIMDLPIIFADDNEVLDPNVPNDLSTNSGSTGGSGDLGTAPPRGPVTKFIPPTSTSKFVLVNKPVSGSGLSNFIITPSSGVKRPNPVAGGVKQPTKFTKIILSKKAVEPLINRMGGGGGFVAPTAPPLDLESELVATAVPNPNFTGDKSDDVVTTKGGNFDPDQMFMDDDDPDYEPPKNLKL
ncbi:KAT8 regulatory NSL complex subunit 3 isoform X2 [Anthonomus grandis grandis]|uniref:KAT8 regulatory NSL complex subunit 3 isoform X2 n=1 Tax=Anthonomus grandis grandis TaxID=2921223 RepID=UPI002164F33F|nr:KAT8 regulatory NSL complex subunit 3 isoform X2 [Anthonomus grandis grandis]